VQHDAPTSCPPPALRPPQGTAPPPIPPHPLTPLPLVTPAAGRSVCIHRHAAAAQPAPLHHRCNQSTHVSSRPSSACVCSRSIHWHFFNCQWLWPTKLCIRRAAATFWHVKSSSSASSKFAVSSACANWAQLPFCPSCRNCQCSPAHELLRSGHGIRCLERCGGCPNAAQRRVRRVVSFIWCIVAWSVAMRAFAAPNGACRASSLASH
jgi:hypothetical protein